MDLPYMADAPNEYTESVVLREIVRLAREFYKIPENRAMYEQYYLEKYGVPYDWSKG